MPGSPGAPALPPALGKVPGADVLLCQHRVLGAAAAACFSFSVHGSVILDHLKGVLSSGEDLLFFYQNQTLSSACKMFVLRL